MEYRGCMDPAPTKIARRVAGCGRQGEIRQRDELGAEVQPKVKDSAGFPHAALRSDFVLRRVSRRAPVQSEGCCWPDSLPHAHHKSGDRAILPRPVARPLRNATMPEKLARLHDRTGS